MRFSLLRYWFFKLKATNEHGVHSPYLYALVCFCFYNKKWKKLRKTPSNNINRELMGKEILKLLNDFSAQAANEFKISKYPVSYKESKDINFKSIHLGIKDCSQIILINNIHLKRKSWIEFIEKSNFIILDLYYFGIIIHRFEQFPEIFSLKVF